MRPNLDWAPYFGPMLGFAVVLAAAEYLPPGWDVAAMVARVSVPAAIFLYFWRDGRYPELRGYRPGAAGAASDVAVGLAVAALWATPYLLFPGLRPSAGGAFDPGSADRMLMLALRLAGFVLVTPVVEELLVRSFLLRAAEVYDTDRDFRDVPIGAFAWRGFVVTVLWFTFTHAQWEWPVAFATGVIYNLWLYRRKHIGSPIVAHAATNAALFGLVYWGSGKIRDAAGEFPDLWFFL